MHGKLPGEQKTLSDYRASVKAKQESVKTEASLGRNVNRRIIGVKVHALAEWRQILGGKKFRESKSSAVQKRKATVCGKSGD